MLYLSFDIATRSLAFTLMFLDKKKLAAALLSGNYKDIDNNVKVIVCEVHDLTDGVKIKNSSVSKRTIKLKEILSNLEKRINGPVKVLLEYQMSINKKANVIFSQIYYHFAEHSPIVIKPCYKNMIAFKESLRYSNFSEKYKNSYCANKAHSKSNFLYFFEAFGLTGFTKNIKKKNLDDAADSFMQIFAYINFYKKDFIFKNPQIQ